MGWQDQGRQTHGWWGHGTGPDGDAPTNTSGDALFSAGNYGPRIDALTHTAFLNLPRNVWHQRNASFDPERQGQLRRILTALIATQPTRPTTFTDGLLNLASDTAIEKLRAAADGVHTATGHEDLAAASADLYRWPRFLEDAAALADTQARPVLLAQAAPAAATDAAPAPPGRYVARDPEQWNGRSSVGDGECVALVKAAADMPTTPFWRQGIQVQGAVGIRPGTIIATFDKNGHYHGHTAIYLGQNAEGIQVIDQWKYDNNGVTVLHNPNHRTIHFGDSWRANVDIGESYYVIE